ncbi:hypothetical protein [Cohnella herbarum]|uniref:Thymidylate kinase-like domain-containing protein n=2 Tax=Cohnella herbarum TaxID=2728023 RepID=A0A7Z2ZKX2_9BACL|nr:hypothetical protein [Cohnella herbarum]QJD83285.1 hypothetical protein HH215_08950 [Cohnella herbarum]
MKTKLIIIDGIPGSGKSTTGSFISERLNESKIPNRFYHELEDNHPLRIYDKQFNSFTILEEAEWFAAKVEQLFSDFINDKLDREEITIMESYVFQDTIGFAFNMQMEEQRLLDLTKKIQSILSRLDPVLIYFYQVNVEQNWRWICEIRGPEFTQGVCGIHTDNDFVEAGKFWTINQDFVFKIVQEWDISKLIIRNENYKWDEYKDRIIDFLG